MSLRLLIAVAIVAAHAPALAQPESRTPLGVDVDAAPVKFDPSICNQPEPVAAPPGTTVPVTWKEFEISGTFVDGKQTVRELIAPTMNRHPALTADARAEIARSAAGFGYHLVGLGTRETPNGTQAIVHLSPLPMVRHINIDMDQPFFSRLLDDEVRRRLRVRVGAYLPWSPRDRFCDLQEEIRRIEEYLRDEGYFDATVVMDHESEGAAVALDVDISLGEAYQTDLARIRIPNAQNLAVGVDEIRENFRHRGTCLIGKRLCFGKARFTRAQHQLDVQKVVNLFRARGFPAVRVRSDFDPAMSIDRRTKTVGFTITIDQRRRLDVVFEGNSVSTDALRKQLTFDSASSVDDFEASESAAAVTAYLQSRGYFDARVTWSRERFGVREGEGFDRIIFRVDQGKPRTVKEVQIVGNAALKLEELEDAIGTKQARLSTSLFGKNTAVTSALLATDVDRLADVYRRAGYRDAHVRVSAATDPAALDNAALTAALLLADRGEGLYVRFTIQEGQPTLLTQVHVELGDKGDQVSTPDERILCRQMLRHLAELYAYPGLAQPVTNDRCIGTATNLRFREDAAAETRDLLKDRLYSHGRPRAEVTYEPTVIGPRRIAAKYRLTNMQELKIGKVVIRGNFRTRESVIRGELRQGGEPLAEGRPLTKNALAEGARRLRNTGLFDAVNITMPDLETASAGGVNAVVEVTERFDYKMQLDIEGGYSSFNGAFAKVIPSLRNLFGLGITLEFSGTIGFDLGTAFEQQELELRQLAGDVTLRIPQWLSRNFSPVQFQTDLTAFHRRQETERFGLLRTTGATLALSRTWDRPRIGKRPAHAITVGAHYDFRSRERNVDSLRPIGADDDESQVPITTRTGSVGATFEWEQRVDSAGILSPLAPVDGFRFDSQISYASPYLLGQNTFIKVSAAGSKYWGIGDHLVLRTDLRYDQGFPLGGAALLPEVERFFAGGDATVRGYEDERLATEVIQVGVPPIANVSQIRILPAGGNIRMMGSFDAQLRVFKIFATALFADAGLITNQWTSVELEDIRPALGMALVRIVTPFGAFAIERAVPLNPRLGDDPRGRWHISFAARAQF